MAKIAILGFGTVGSGVYEVLCRNAAGVSRRAGEPVEVKYILDPKDFSNHPDAHLFIKNFDTILEDPEIKVVVETIGGTRFAYPYVKACLESGRSVCTSNKEMVATYGAELLGLAKEHGCAFLFEASVGGGTPIITPMHQCLAANVITEVEGIVNGTTNFMLTKMIEEGMGFEDALALAQKLGYAERDPSADIDGHDACRKICILASLAFGRHVYPDQVHTEGISRVSAADVQYAAAWGGAVKLIGRAVRQADGRLYAVVSPMLLKKSSLLADVSGVFNGIMVRGDAIGDVVFYGQGAGKLPTASAVVADVIDEVKHLGARKYLFWERGSADYVVDYREEALPVFLRLASPDLQAARNQVQAAFGPVGYIACPKAPDGELAFISPRMKEKDLDAALAAMQGVTVRSRIRVADL